MGQRANIAVQLPAGMVIPFAGATAPAGFLICDGASLLRASYTALFAIIGTTYGSADGTHFSLPNLKGKIPVGVNASETEFDTLGETGGSKAPALLSHSHAISLKQNPGGTNIAPSNLTSAEIASVNTASASSGNQTAGNMPPYIALNYIIKT